MISLIELEPNAKEPMYQQIYRALTSQIMGGTLKEGEYLPSKRVLCDTLNVSHSTVESAYALMLAEGYIESIPRKGYRVLRILALPDETETSLAENSQHLPEDDSSNQSDDFSISRQKLSFSTSSYSFARGSFRQAPINSKLLLLYLILPIIKISCAPPVRTGWNATPCAYWTARRTPGS